MHTPVSQRTSVVFVLFWSHPKGLHTEATTLRLMRGGLMKKVAVVVREDILEAKAGHLRL